MEETSKHWTVLIKERYEHVQTCHVCQVFPNDSQCVEYIVLTARIKRAFDSWIND